MPDVTTVGNWMKYRWYFPVLFLTTAWNAQLFQNKKISPSTAGIQSWVKGVKTLLKMRLPESRAVSAHPEGQVAPPAHASSTGHTYGPAPHSGGTW